MKESFRLRVQKLKGELNALMLAYGDKRVPLYAKIFLALMLGYVFSPLDLIPDFIPVLGLFDELILVPAGIYLAVKMIPPEVMADCRVRASAGEKLNLRIRWIAAIVIILLWSAALLWVANLIFHFM